MPAMNPLAILGEITKVLAQLPPGTLESVLGLAEVIVKSGDPKQAVKRAALAAASEQVSEATLRELLP